MAASVSKRSSHLDVQTDVVNTDSFADSLQGVVAGQHKMKSVTFSRS